MIVAVTGASGQLGVALVRRLLADRQVERVVSIDLRVPVISSGKLRHIQGDIRTLDLTAHLRGCDSLVHLAFLVSGNYPRAIMDSVNIDGSKRVFFQAVDAGVRHLVFASSAAAYGAFSDQPIPLTEESPRRYQHDFAYAATKQRVEEFLDELETSDPNLSVARLRPAMVIGPYMDHPLQDLLRRGRLPYTSTPLQAVWEDDVVEAFVLAVKGKVHGAYNLGAEEARPARDLAAALGIKVLRIPQGWEGWAARACSVLAPTGLTHSVDPAWLRLTNARLVVSSEKARRELNWNPRYGTVTAVFQRYLTLAPGRLDLRLSWFMRLAHLGGVYGPPTSELRKVYLLIQLDLTGRGGGRFSVAVRDGQVSIRRRQPSAPDAIVTLDASLFRRILSGKTSWGKEQLVGKIRAEGQAHAPMVVAGIISTYRSSLSQPGLAGMVTRGFSRWVEAGTNR